MHRLACRTDPVSAVSVAPGVRMLAGGFVEGKNRPSDDVEWMENIWLDRWLTN